MAATKRITIVPPATAPAAPFPNILVNSSPTETMRNCVAVLAFLRC